MFKTLLRQRVYGICAGYEDCNDAASLSVDPIHIWAVGARLASQPSLSRFENSQDFAVFKRLNALLLIDVSVGDLQGVPPGANRAP
jgi:hypothetical protein